MTKEGIFRHAFSKIALSFLLIISMVAPFISGQSATAATTITVAEAIAKNNSGERATVRGYIIGTTSTGPAYKTTGPFTVGTNIAIADNPNETDSAKIMPVELPSGSIYRTELNLADNPSKHNVQIDITGKLVAYFGAKGLKTPTAYSVVGGVEPPPPPVVEKVESIQEARDTNSTDKLIEVKGTVTTGIGYWGGKGFYIQDDTAGLYIYTSSTTPAVKQGDNVTLTGKVTTYGSEMQMASPSIVVNLSNQPLPNIQTLTPAQLEESNEGELVKFDNVTISNLIAKDFGTIEFTATNESNESATVRIDNRTGMVYEEFIKYYKNGDLIDVVGISSDFNGTFQLKPRGITDIDLVNKPAVYSNVFPGYVTEDSTITLNSGWENSTIYYTVDGSTPTIASAVYDEPIVIKENTIIKAIAVTTEKTSEQFLFEYQVIKSSGVQIADIQGKQHKTPYMDQLVVDIEGVVTYKLDNNNFFMQDPTPDQDPATSDAILVYSKGHAFVPGDVVLVDGKVTEWFIAGYQEMKSVDLSTTEITNTTIEKTGTAPVPAALKIGTDIFPPTEIIDNDELKSYNPIEDGIDFWESIEGMLVSVENAKVLGPQKYGEVIVATDNGGKTKFNDFGGINLTEKDYNPERITIDMNSESFVAKSGDVFNGTITGPVSYEFGNYRIMTTVTDLPELIVAPIVKEVTDINKVEDKLNVAAYNVENFSNNVSQTPNEKVEKIAKSFVENMKSPDIITLVEVQDNDGATGSNNADATESYERLIAAIVAAGGPTYAWTDIAPEYNQDGGQPGGNIRVGYLYNPERVTLAEGIKGGSSEAVTWVDGELSKNPGRILDLPQQNTRKPLAAQFEFKGEKVVVIGAHLNSKGGDQPLFGKNQPPFLGSESERIELAQMINNFIKAGQAQDPNLKVIVAGDMNDFEFTPTLAALKGGILTNMIEKVPAGERFTYYYQGNNQVLDHILVTDNIADRTKVDIIHVNANYMEMHGRASDHDPVLIQVDLKDPVNNTPPSTPTNPGQVTADESAVSNQAKDPAVTEVKVTVPALTDAQPEVSAKVPTASLQTIAQSSKPLVIASGNTEVVVPNEILKNIAAGNPESVTVSVKMAKSTDVNGAVSATFEFTITTVKNGNTSTVSTFSTPVEVTVPVAATDIKDPRKVAAYYMNESTKGLEYVGGTYGNGQVVFSTNHFSKFVVVENNKTFSDIQKYWAQDQIEVLASRAITSGKTDTTFNPEGQVTRAEFAVLIARSLNLPMETYKGTFKDVTTSKAWAYAGIEAAHRAGIVNGKTTMSFDPDALITREEIATMIVRAVKYQDANLLKDVDTSKTFADEKAIGDFAKVSIKQAVGLGIVTGRAGNKLDPKANATRAEAAVMLYRALDKLNEF